MSKIKTLNKCQYEAEHNVTVNKAFNYDIRVIIHQLFNNVSEIVYFFPNKGQKNCFIFFIKVFPVYSVYTDVTHKMYVKYRTSCYVDTSLEALQ